MKKDVVKILPLGGQAEMGKSMYCIEIKEQIFILDAGFRFPEVSKLGVDIIIPSFDYLKENKERVVAIIITHGHDDVMAALPYLLEAVIAPVLSNKALKMPYKTAPRNPPRLQGAVETY